MTGNSIMQQALLLAKRIRNINQVASVDDIAIAQSALNNLLDEMNGMGIAIYSVAPITFSLQTGVSSYTIGTGGTINVPRPAKVEAWNVRTSSGQANGGKPVDAEEFATIAADRGAVGARVKALNYDAAFPLGSVHLYPAPSGGTLELWVWSALAQIADFTLTVTYPPAYAQAIIYGLAMAMGPDFGTPIDPAVKLTADTAFAALGITNASQRRQPVAPAAT